MLEQRWKPRLRGLAGSLPRLVDMVIRYEADGELEFETRLTISRTVSGVKIDAATHHAHAPSIDLQRALSFLVNARNTWEYSRLFDLL